MKEEKKNILTLTLVVENSQMNKLDDFAEIKEILLDLGVIINLGDFDTFSDKTFCDLVINKSSLKKSRGGRRKIDISSDKKFIKYSDIILMMQQMSDKQIMEDLGVKHATFYRRKKTMLESKYYKNLDKNRLDDKEYLENIDPVENNYF